MNRPGASPGNQFRSGGIDVRMGIWPFPRLSIPPSGDQPITERAQQGGREFRRKV